MHHILQDIQYISRKNDTNIYWELRWAQTFIYFFLLFQSIIPKSYKDGIMICIFIFREIKA